MPPLESNDWALNQLLLQIRDTVNSLGGKIEDLRKETKSDLDEVYKQINGIRTVVNDHPTNCPLNKFEVHKMIDDKIQKLKEEPDKSRKRTNTILTLIISTLTIILLLFNIYDRYSFSKEKELLQKRVERIEGQKQ